MITVVYIYGMRFFIRGTGGVSYIPSQLLLEEFLSSRPKESQKHSGAPLPVALFFTLAQESVLLPVRHVAGATIAVH